MKDLRAPSKTALFDAAKCWDAAAVKAILKVVPALVTASDSRGRMALHLACAVKAARGKLGEPNGIRTVAALLAAGAPLEAEVPMDEEEGDFRATPVWYALARRKPAAGSVSSQTRSRCELLALGGCVAR